MRVANPYYAQSLLPAVERTFQLVPGQVLLGPMVSQLGIATGLLLVLPLGDRSDRRRMLMLLALAMAAACGSVVAAPSYGMLLSSWFALGLVALIPSLLPPFLAAITPEAIRGRILGLVLSGQFTGILLSRSVSGVLGQRWGWRAIGGWSGTCAFALVLVGIAAVLERATWWATNRASNG
jgi:MFS family permease